MSSGSDNELLFGIFAMQLNFVSREQLIAAAARWTENRAVPISKLLVEDGALTAERSDLLCQLIREHARSTNDDESLASMVSPSSLQPLADQLRTLDDKDLNATVDRIAEGMSKNLSGSTPSAATAETAVFATRDAGRFRVLRPHAKGGLGHVSVALDKELNREVALKEIQGQFSGSEESRFRFVQEAEITGSLEHPGIVPVYGLGRFQDGRPFYVMRLIRGDSLKEAIRDFHSKASRNEERSLALRQLLGRFVDVCNAVEYAHSRGVLHRDLKPGNIMLGRYGETLVVDWGLAKSVTRDDRQRGSGEMTLVPSGSGSTLTVDGQTVGTPAYMSPEQAEGKLDTLGPATDVYSLGATLYCLLTGQSPFSGLKGFQLLPRVIKGDFPEPRKVNSKIPAALEAICLKAMARIPDDRYADPTELALDVERWMADEPISVYSEPWTERLARIVRRNKSRAVVAAAAVLLLTAVSTIAAVLVNSARLETTRQLHVANALRLATVAQSMEEAPNRSGLVALAALDATDRHTLPPLPEAQAVILNTLNRMSGNYVTTLNGPVHELRVSPDERNLLARSFDGDYWRIDLLAQPIHESFERITTPKQRPVRRILTDDWRYEVQCRADRVLEVHDTATRKVRLLRGMSPNVGLVRLMANNRWVIAVGSDRHVRIWDLEQADAQPTFVIKTERGWQLAGDLRERRLAVADASGVRLFEIGDDGPKETTLPQAAHRSRELLFSKDGRFLVATGRDEATRVWHLATDPIDVRNIDLAFPARTLATFAPDSRTLAFDSGEGKVSLLRFDDQVQPETVLINYHTGSVEGLEFDSSGQKLAVMGGDDKISVWSVVEETPQLITTIRSHDATARAGVFSPDSRWIYTGDPSGMIRKTNLERGQDTDAFQHFRTDADRARIVWRPGTSELYFLGETISMVNFEDPTRRRKLLDRKGSGGLTSDGRWLIAHDLRSLKTYDLNRTGSEPQISEVKLRSLLRIAVSPDGNWLTAMGGRKGLWKRENGEWIADPIAEFPGVFSWSAAFSPDSKSVAIPGLSVRIYSVERPEKPPLELPLVDGNCFAVEYSRDGHWLAAGEQRGLTYLWDMTAADPAMSRRDLSGHTANVLGVAFDPSGRWMATCSSDETVRLRDLRGDPEAACIVLRPSDVGVQSVTFSPDGQWLVALDANGEVFSWKLDFSAAAKELRSRIGRELTPDERREFRLFKQE